MRKDTYIPEHSLMFCMPSRYALLPLFSRQVVLVHDTIRMRNRDQSINQSVRLELPSHLPLRQEPVVGQVSRRVKLFVVISIFGLHSIGSQKDRRFRRTVDFVSQDRVLDLQVKQAHRNILNELFGHVFRIEFGAEFELQRALLFDVLV